MRILLWSQHDTRSLGGVEVLMRTLAEGLMARGHQLALIAGQTDPSEARHEIVDGLPVHRFPFFEALTSRSATAIGDIMAGVSALKRSFRADVIHLHLTDAGPFFHLRTLDPNSVCVLSFHQATSGAQSSWPLARALAARSQAIVTPSLFVAGDMAAALDISADRIQTIHPGVDMGGLLAVPAPAPDGDFITLGRLVREKGFDDAIDAIAILAREGRTARLRIIGAGPHDAALAMRARERGVTSLVSFPGRIGHDALHRAFDRSLAMLMPSLVPEAFGIAAADAALAGRAVIASRLGALPEVVLDGETGLLVEPGDPASLATAMKRLLDEPDLSERLGRAARSRARDLYGAARMVDAHEALYRKLLAAPVNPASGDGAEPSRARRPDTSRD